MLSWYLFLITFSFKSSLCDVKKISNAEKANIAKTTRAKRLGLYNILWYTIHKENRRHEVTIWISSRLSEKWLRIQFEPMPATTGDIHWFRSRGSSSIQLMILRLLFSWMIIIGGGVRRVARIWKRGGAILKEWEVCKRPWLEFSWTLNKFQTVCPKIEMKCLGKLGNSKVFSSKNWVISKKKRSSPKFRVIFRPKSEIQRFFPPKIRWSPKKKKVFEKESFFANLDVWGGLFSIFRRKSASKAQKICDFAYFTSQWGGSSPPAPPWLRYWVESSRTFLASRMSSKTRFEVLGLGLEGQVLWFALKASSSRKLPCSQLEDSTIFWIAKILQIAWKQILQTFFLSGEHLR